MPLILMVPLASDPGLPGWDKEDVTISVTPWAGSTGAVRVESGTNLILPETDTFSVTKGEYSKPFRLIPTGLNWCWKITVEARRLKVTITRYVILPAVDEITWADMIDVDPNTFMPKATPPAVWQASLMELQRKVELIEQTGGGESGQAILDHINDPTPHGAYDNITDLKTLFQSKVS